MPETQATRMRKAALLTRERANARAETYAASGRIFKRSGADGLANLLDSQPIEHEAGVCAWCRSVDTATACPAVTASTAVLDAHAAA